VGSYFLFTGFVFANDLVKEAPMSDFRFESPGLLMLLWLVLALYFVTRYFDKMSIRSLGQNIDSRLIPFLTESLSAPRRVWKIRLQLLVLALLILAWARPQSGEGRVQVKNEGIEFLFLVDVSNSMLVEDIKPSRLAVAKSEINRLIDISTGDRVGVVAFAGSAVLLSPMTNDHEAIKMYIDSLDSNSVSTQGTDFSKALTEARDAFKRGGLGEQDDAQVTRAILIFSDGEDQEPGAEALAAELVKSGIHIFSVALGSEEGGAIPVRDDQGQLRGYKRDKGGQVIMSKTKGTVLKDLAKAGKGSFHHAAFQGDAVKQLRADIEQLKKSQFESGEMRTYDEKFQILLILALVLGLIELWLGDRKTRGRIWQGRFEVAGD